MKILWLSHLVPYPPKGGVLQRSYNLVRETCKHHDLTLLAFIQPDLIKSRLSTMDSGLAEAHLHLSEFCDHVEFIEIPCESSKYGKHLLALKSLFTADPYTINWLKSDLMRTTIHNISNTSKFDLIHFDTISLAPYASEFPDTAKALDHHNIESHMMLRRAEQEKNLFKKLYYYQEGKKLLHYEKKVYSQFNIHLTCSTLDSGRLRKIDTSLNVKEIPNGVDTDYFYPQPNNEIQNNLIFAGSLSWYPNKDAMLYFSRKIWPLLKKQNHQITMNVVGSSPPQELLTLAKKDTHFKVHGFVDDVRDYISMSSIYVCPIRDGGGTKLKILDAFAMGIATVAHPAACEGIAAVDGENVLFASTPEAYVEKIMLLIKDGALKKQLGENARTTAVKNYGYIAIGETLSQQYIKTVKNY